MTTKITLVGGPTAVIDFAGTRSVTEPTFDASRDYPHHVVTTLTRTRGPARLRRAHHHRGACSTRPSSSELAFEAAQSILTESGDRSGARRIGGHPRTAGNGVVLVLVEDAHIF